MPKGKKINGSSYKTANWVFKVVLLTFTISFVISLFSESLISGVGIILAFFILIIIVFIGIVFDIIGIAVTSANETPFHSMSADKVRGGKEAVRLIRNADIVANFCNDVVGDISGIISGAAGAAIIIKLSGYGLNFPMIGIIMSAIIATVTVGGKAIGKGFAINRSRFIVHKVALVLAFLSQRTGIELLPGTNGKKVRR